MIDDFRKHVGDVAAADRHLVMFACQPPGHKTLEHGLVVFGVLEAERKGLQAAACKARAEGGDKRAVQAA
ncbi:hypothetical protein D3C83_97720 [compost metagenome]